MNRPHLAIVGGGPFCTYALERLAALLPHARLPRGLRISVFERGGRFGAGATHSDLQASSSYMNRVASQIAFAADESNVDARRLLPAALRPTFAEWARARYEREADQRFKLQPADVPHRYLHGVALRVMFDRYATLLQQRDDVTLDCYAAEVTDIEKDEQGGGVWLHVGAVPGWREHAERVLLVTGHSHNRARPGSTAELLARHAANQPGVSYVPQTYPLAEFASERRVPAGCSVGVLGLGLTAIDLLLYLTEGRGGHFVAEPESGPCPRLRYVASGREPRKIVAVSPSGMFTSARPRNAKAGDPSGAAHSALEHHGVFLTLEAVRTLRRLHGVPALLSCGEVRQVDFDRHVFPLVVLELAFVYYATLLGKRFAEQARRATNARYQAFLEQPPASQVDAIEQLLQPMQAAFDQAARYIDSVSSGSRARDDELAGSGVVEAFRAVVDCPSGGGSSPWGHPTLAREHRFDWRSFFEPLGKGGEAGHDWQQKLIEHMRRDHLAAIQGNLQNPTKAACDGVWRDLRAVFSEVADFGGLNAGSHRRFKELYWRFYTRMSNGTDVEPMRKMLALVEAGLLDVSIGPDPSVAPVAGRAAYRVSGSVTQAEREVEVVIEGKGHPFDAEHDAAPLYPNLLRRGLIRRWRNPGGAAAPDFVPGGLDLSRGFHPLQADGSVESRLTVLGSPAEGVTFFQLSAARPRSNSGILNNVARWANELVETLERAPAPRRGAMSRERAPDGEGASIVAFRSRIRALMARELAHSSPRDLVLLAVDGIPYEQARARWTKASVARMRSVFPPTSSTAWLSSLTGADVGCHGIPGVVFRLPNQELINVFQHRGPLHAPKTGNVFSDAADLGYVPMSIMGDWEPHDCSWRTELLEGSRPVRGFRFYTAPTPAKPEAIAARLLESIVHCLREDSLGAPKLVWCFVDADQHIHAHGYDDELLRLLDCIDELGAELSRRGALVVAHSDHGLVATHHNPKLADFMRGLELELDCKLGGAGRTRWFYTAQRTQRQLVDALERELPKSIRLRAADDVFGTSSLARARVGDVVLIADGDDFITFSDHRFDHGSATTTELEVPLAHWLP